MYSAFDHDKSIYRAWSYGIEQYEKVELEVGIMSENLIYTTRFWHIAIKESSRQTTVQHRNEWYQPRGEWWKFSART